MKKKNGYNNDGLGGNENSCAQNDRNCGLELSSSFTDSDWINSASTHAEEKNRKKSLN